MAVGIGVGVGIGIGIGVAVAVGSGAAVGVGIGVTVGSRVGVSVEGVVVGSVVVRLTSDAHATITNSNVAIAKTALENFIPKTPSTRKHK